MRAGRVSSRPDHHISDRLMPGFRRGMPIVGHIGFRLAVTKLSEYKKGASERRPRERDLGQRNTRRGKPHCEAFPALDILQALRSWRAGNGSCEWRDERGVLVGRGQLVALEQARATFAYDMAGSTNIAAKSHVLFVDLTGSRRNPNVVRQSFNCPRCQARAQKLFYVTGRWACRGCHGLVYIKQRLGSVNKRLHNRDAMLAVLQQVPQQNQCWRWFYNQQRHLERINRELAAEGHTSLPQELLFRNYADWPSADVAAGTDEAARQGASRLGDPTADGSDVGLAFFRSLPPTCEPATPGELVGSLILDRPLTPWLTSHKADCAMQLMKDLRKEAVTGSSISIQRFANLLAERLVIRPLVITSGWSDVTSIIGEGGRAEHVVTATYTGDPTLWRIGPGTKPNSRVLRAVLDDRIIMLRARPALEGRSDPHGDLESARDEISYRLARVEEVLASFNASRDDLALRWVRHNWRRLQREDFASPDGLVRIAGKLPRGPVPAT